MLTRKGEHFYFQRNIEVILVLDPLCLRARPKGLACESAIGRCSPWETTAALVAASVLMRLVSRGKSVAAGAQVVQPFHLPVRFDERVTRRIVANPRAVTLAAHDHSRHIFQIVDLHVHGLDMCRYDPHRGNPRGRGGQILRKPRPASRRNRGNPRGRGGRVTS